MGKNKKIIQMFIIILTLPIFVGFSFEDFTKKTSFEIEGKIIILKHLANEYEIKLEEICNMSINNQEISVDEEGLMKKINDLAGLINVAPVDAKIQNYKTFTITKEVDGVLLDGAILAQMIRDYVKNGELKDKHIIDIPVILEKAKITEAMLREKLSEKNEAEEGKKTEGVELASFTTSYNPKDRNRTENLRLSTQAINGFKLGPGEVFSMDKTLGVRTERKGYKYAAAFSGGEVVKSLAGGICQTTTTMYNAALFANLKIIERYKHGLPVSYINKGRDATIYSSVYDLKAKNIYDFPIIINASINNEKGTLTVKLIGLKKVYNVKIFTEHKKIRNKDYYYTYRQVYDISNALIKKELISTDVFTK